jgi:glycerophosphoryl diester phosphodiesterase
MPDLSRRAPVPRQPGLTLAADRPIVVAHRGASVEQPENTIAAFEAAIEAGADAVEFDVRLTRDGHAVVMHDPDVARTTDGHGRVSDLTLAEVRRLGIALPGGGAAGVPTLDEALGCLSGRAAADIELKNGPEEPGYDPRGSPALEATLDGLEHGAFGGPVLLSSFDEPTLRRSRSRRPDVPTGLLTEAGTDVASALEAAARGKHPWVLPFVGQVLSAGPEVPAEAHEARLRLGVWIADDEEMARTLFGWGVDAVATNDPRAIVPVRDAVVP